MNSITGKTLLFTDIHFGLKNNSLLRLKVCVDVIKQIIAKLKQENIKNVIFCGDWHHSRNFLDVQTVNISSQCLSTLSKYAHVYLILGNHDIYNKNDLKINSLMIFKENKNLTVIDKPTEITINGKIAILCPWLSDLSNFKKDTYDYMFGHFDVSTKYIIDSYVKDNKTDFSVSNEELENALEDDELNTVKNNRKEDESVSFIEYAKPSVGLVFSGHIHKRKEMTINGRKFLFMGSPTQQTMGDLGDTRGYYILDENGTYRFIETVNVPKHIELKMSDIIKDVDKFDFSVVKNNIIQKIYDVEVDHVVDCKIMQKIQDNKPYDELMSIYEISDPSVKNDESVVENEFITMLRKSKLDYLRNYVSNIDTNVLEENKLDSSKLLDIMETYYNKATRG